jgi:hypothetical protein
LLIMVNANDLGNPEADTFMSGRKVAKGVGDIPWIKSAGRNLIEQRLKGVVGKPVEQRNSEPFFGQLLGCR